jgi:hypothetical protein
MILKIATIVFLVGYGLNYFFNIPLLGLAVALASLTVGIIIIAKY